jgi:hypothetical protein
MGRARASAYIATIIAGLVLSCASGTQGAVIFGVQPSTGTIVRVNPATGVTSGGFIPPSPPTAGQTLLGLSGAENGSILLYRNYATNNTAVYRLNASTGALVSSFAAQNWANDGISYENIGGQDNVYYSHSAADVHHSVGYGGGETFFFTTGTPAGGLGGDGNAREFANMTDGIHEYNPSTGALINTFPAPSANVKGLAFDGTNLYASNTTGQIFTLNPNNGAILATASVVGGPLLELGSALPEPSMGCCLLAVMAGGMFRRRRAA